MLQSQSEADSKYSNSSYSHRPHNSESAPRSQDASNPPLEIRARDSPLKAQPHLARPPLAQPPLIERQPTPINKRKVSSFIDLTLDNDDNGNDLATSSIARKKSRSSSHSTEASSDLRIDQGHKALDKPVPTAKSLKLEPSSSSGRVFYAAKSTKTKEKRPGVHSLSSSIPSRRQVSNLSAPLIPSRNHISAVLVPPPQPSPAECRRIFLENLRVLRGVTLVNIVDDTSPPLEFKFAQESTLGNNVTRTTKEFMSGCNCRIENGRSIGCEYLSCECLDDSQLNPAGKKVFPYAAGKHTLGCLRDFYLTGGYHVYECNERCNCLSNCKNRVVQHGRTVPVEIFKTTNRGWGLRCRVELKKGQFVDTYRGEILTHEEAECRGRNRPVGQDNYLFDLDRWEDESEGYTCDGMYMGGPTRFINHSCDPNCRIMTVSYNHADINIYDLAFFATEPIPAGTELTFDYGEGTTVNREDDQDDRGGPAVVTDTMAEEMAKEKGYPPTRCLCGARDCRRYFFT